MKDPDVRAKTACGKSGAEGRYELTWAGKERCKVEAGEPARSMLLPCLEGSVDWDTTRNVYIEGDNLEALRLLQDSYRGAVKLIYIDPPYNTGGGFIYNDDFSAGQGGVRRCAHSGMAEHDVPALLLARQLLREDGAIAMSINENELFGLKLVCDEIFGEENYLTTFSVKVRHENRILKGDKDFHEVMEYLLLYRRSKAFRAAGRAASGGIRDYVWLVEELECPSETVAMGAKQVQLFRAGQYRITKQEAGRTLLKRINIRGALKEGNSSGRFYMKYLDAYGEKGLLFKVPDIGDDGLGFRYFLTPQTQRRRNGDYFQGVPAAAQGARQCHTRTTWTSSVRSTAWALKAAWSSETARSPWRFWKRCWRSRGCKGRMVSCWIFSQGRLRRRMR